jgi:hypothetical protein
MSSVLAESLKKELSDDEPRPALKLVVEPYGTVPRKCMPWRTLPVITRLPLVSIGLGFLIRPLWRLLGGTVLDPAGFSIERFSIDQLVDELRAKNTAITVIKSRFFIIQSTFLSFLIFW